MEIRTILGLRSICCALRDLRMEEDFASRFIVENPDSLISKFVTFTGPYKNLFLFHRARVSIPKEFLRKNSISIPNGIHVQLIADSLKSNIEFSDVLSMIVQSRPCLESSHIQLKSLKALFSQDFQNLKALMIHGLFFNGFIDKELLGLIQSLTLELLHLQYCPQIPYFTFGSLKRLHLVFDEYSLNTCLIVPNLIQDLVVYVSSSNSEHQIEKETKVSLLSALACKSLKSV
jgi:hypothetical protein